ncbi:MAG: prepilin peptidase [Nanoarchaeota archaeon]|nr:prepilin peptidase [Nanoarchaeota archaeon]
MITQENLFLIFLGLIWIVGAVLQDLRRREVDNIWNFSLIFFALSYRFSYSIHVSDYWFIINGLIGFFIFLIVGNLFYYSRLFAGGDAKLLIALGTILPLSNDWVINFKIFGAFILLFLVAGSLYVLIWSLFLVVLNFKKFSKEFYKQIMKFKYLFILSIIFAIFWIVLGYFISILAVLSIAIMVVLFPLLFVFARSVEESCMVKLITPDKLTEGDWLYKDIYVGDRKIESCWDGVTKEELRVIKNKCRRKILIKIGVPFTPAFLLGILALIYIFIYHPGLFL